MTSTFWRASHGIYASCQVIVKAMPFIPKSQPLLVRSLFKRVNDEKDISLTLVAKSCQDHEHPVCVSVARFASANEVQGETISLSRDSNIDDF